MAAGMIVIEAPGGALLRFALVGYVVVGAALVTLFLMNRLRRAVGPR